MPSRTNLSAGIPSSKVKYSKLSSTDDGYIDLQVKTGEGSWATTRMGSHSLAFHRRLLLVHLWWSSCSSDRGKAWRQPNPRPFPSGNPKEPSWEQGWEKGLAQQGLHGQNCSWRAILEQNFVPCQLCQLWGPICAQFGCSVFGFFHPVQEEPTQNPLQGHRAGCGALHDRDLPHHHRSPAAGRVHQQRGECLTRLLALPSELP